ncbi:MAG: hypothetical protein GY953_00475, partial [bacterium]|nr:hypothetical protein [bacterium]
MRVKLAMLGLAVCLAAGAAVTLNVKQLIQFISSSIDLGHQDGKVAKYLKGVTITERLEDRTIESLQGLGAGPKTVQALRRLREASAGLPTAAPPKPKSKRPPPPPPSISEQNRIIEEVRNYAMNYTSRLPDFICTQVTRRYGDPSGLEFWRKLDTVTAKVSYFDKREDYRIILVNNKPVSLTMDEVGGSTSQGEFGTLMLGIFKPETEANFGWLRWGTLRGNRAHVYAYRVRQEKSDWGITYEKTESVVPAYSGLIYVDQDTHEVLRVTLEAQNIPPAFPVQEAETTLDYAYV